MNSQIRPASDLSALTARALILMATPPEHLAPALLGLGTDLLCQSRLADAGLAGKQDEPAAAVFNKEDEEKVKERLKALGYID